MNRRGKAGTNRSITRTTKRGPGDDSGPDSERGGDLVEDHPPADTKDDSIWRTPSSKGGTRVEDLNRSRGNISL